METPDVPCEKGGVAALRGSLPAPRTERAILLRSRMDPQRWDQLVRLALWRRDVVREVEREGQKGHGARATRLREVAPGVHWSTFCYWRRCIGVRGGPEWERLLDGRVPPPAKPVNPEVKAAAVAMRRVNRQVTCGEARRHLVSQFGPEGKVSDATLHRVWRAHGVNNPEAGDPARFERVVRYSGGAALALVGAAAAESGLPQALARAAQQAGKARVAEQGDDERLAADPHVGRDEKGRFTKAYNEAVRKGVGQGERDSRWDPDTVKRQRRDLGSLSILSLAPETLGQRLLTMGMVPLVSSQRGFDGMDAPRARWLRVLGWRAYRPSTLDKTLSELGVLGADEALWETHGQHWSVKAREWAAGGPDWLQITRYLDLTADPHWTHLYALSGKVSRTGRVQPCLQRAMLTAGPGVAIWMESVPGTQDLKRFLRELVEEERRELECAEEPGIAWITVVDAGAANPSLLEELSALTRHRFVTVVKGTVRKGAAVKEVGLWIPYRQRDLLCEVEVVLTGGLVLRGVMMERNDSRHPHRTLFVTDATEVELSTTDVADIYLSRWPNQEFIFRRARHGAGMEHSHGFTGEFVTHVALKKKQADAERRVARLQEELHSARAHAVDARVLQIEVEDPIFGEVAAEAARLAQKKANEVETRHRKAVAAKDQQNTMPEMIFARDTTRENVATALTLSVMMLVEWVLREYLGGVRMELQTFLNYFLYLPVEVRTSWHRVLYRIEVDDLSEQKAALLRNACEVINRRSIRHADRRLAFEVFRRFDEDD